MVDVYPPPAVASTFVENVEWFADRFRSSSSPPLHGQHGGPAVREHQAVPLRFDGEGGLLRRDKGETNEERDRDVPKRNNRTQVDTNAPRGVYWQGRSRNCASSATLDQGFLVLNLKVRERKMEGGNDEERIENSAFPLPTTTGQKAPSRRARPGGERLRRRREGARGRGRADRGGGHRLPLWVWRAKGPSRDLREWERRNK